MEVEALVLLEDNPDACKMVVTWPETCRRAPEIEDAEDPLERREILWEWAHVSGLLIEQIERWAPMLWETEICYEDGSVDPTAMGFIRANLSRLLPGGGGQRG